MLEVRDLHVKFHNRDREAVAGVSFTLKDGEILGLVGESGSGKSVTAMSIAGLLPRKKCDYRGDVLVDGEDMLHANRALLRSSTQTGHSFARCREIRSASFSRSL